MIEADKVDGKEKVEVVVLTKNGGFGLYRRWNSPSKLIDWS
jgi:hypothetical protein